MKKVLDIRLDGKHIECIRTDDRDNPFRIYLKNANHRRQVAKYGDFLSVVNFIRNYYEEGADSFTLSETIEWAKAGSVSFFANKDWRIRK